MESQRELLDQIKTALPDILRAGLAELQGQVQRIDEELLSLKDRVVKLESNPPLTTPKDLDQTDKQSLLAELHERALRSKNVIFFNVPESGNIGEDLQLVNDLFQQIENCPSARSAYRLGANTTSKPRPLKLVFESDKDALSVLRKRADWKRSGYIARNDLTPDQSKYYTSVRDSLKQRIENGEKNLSIKFIKGIPTIITKNE